MFNTFPSELLWFLVGLIFMLIELISPGFIVFFFAIGAWVTWVFIWIGVVESLNAQLLVFLISSVLSLALFRKRWKKYFRGKISGVLDESESVDDVKGERAITLADLRPGEIGKVEFRGSPWSAQADVPIKKGKTVEVLERKNLILRVKPIQ